MSQRLMPFSQIHQAKGASQTSTSGGQTNGSTRNTVTPAAHTSQLPTNTAARFRTSPTIHRGVKRDG